MKTPSFFHPIVSFAQKGACTLLPNYAGFGSMAEHRLTLGSHPLANLYQASEKEHKQFKKAMKEQCSLEYAALKELEHSPSLKTNPRLEKTKQAIQQLIHQKFHALSPTEKNRIYGEIYELARPCTNDPQWGEHHVFDSLPLLINAMSSAGMLSSSSTIRLPLWEKEKNLDIKSHFYVLDQRRDPQLGEIGYINGIGTSFDQARWDAYRFSDSLASSHNIHGVYNATHGYLTDLYVSLQSQKKVVSEPVKLLLEQWNHFFLSQPQHVRYLQLCHSQGAIMVALALSFLPQHLRERMCVIAMAPAYFFSPNEAGQIIHIIKKEDTVAQALAQNRDLIAPNNKSIITVPSDSGCHPHDPHGPSYTEEARPYVQRYLLQNSLF